MCGIVGFVGRRPTQKLLLDGLSRLEYRGYDSAGVALQGNDGAVDVVRAVGNLAALRTAADRLPVGAGASAAEATVGIGHTRWATHGRVTEANAHPHTDTTGRVHIVLNGIVENYLELREELTAEGAVFSSETDAEVVAHLIAHAYEGDIAEALARSLERMRGHYAIAAIHADEPGRVVATRKECPLVIGAGDGEFFIASAVQAFVEHTDQIIELVDGDLVSITADEITFVAGTEKPVVTADVDRSSIELGDFDTFMRKEISEQPSAVAHTVFDRLAEGHVELDLGVSDEQLADLTALRVIGCGTSYHAALIGQQLIETWAELPVEVAVASEYRYRTPLVGEGDLVVGVTQSGETADTLAAMRMARERGATVLALTNVPGSQATRDADGILFTQAGSETSVAATKTFVAQVAGFSLLALKLAQVRGTLPEGQIAALTNDLARMPDLIDQTISRTEEWAKRTAAELAEQDFFMFLGRHVGVPVAQEAALKLKEITYIPADAYAAGEMKHGPIALLSEGTPVICVATESPVLDKLHSNMAEVRARGARVIAVATDGDTQTASFSDDVVTVPESDWLLQPLLAIVPLQLLAYYIAGERGLNVDQPRNLAKTVTVE